MSVRDIKIELDVEIDDNGEETYVGCANGLKRLKGRDLSHATFVVQHPEESEDGKALLTIKPKRRKPLTADLVFSEIQRAEEWFKDTGYVGLGYFLTGWKSHDLPTNVDRRQELLDDLVEAGRVEVFLTSEGKEAIQTVSEPHSGE